VTTVTRPMVCYALEQKILLQIGATLKKYISSEHCMMSVLYINRFELVFDIISVCQE
jgi:hypothetical protein